jgi:RNA polymerase sigma-70 factor (ECF subfamily)
MSGEQEMRRERETRWRALMVAAQDGDAVAYEKLLGELLPYLRRFVRRRVFDPAAAEDVVQNVLLSIHRARHTYRPERPFGPWLHAIARNAVTDHVRARGRALQRERPLEDSAAAEASFAPPAPGEAGLEPRLLEALAELPAKQREAVELLHLDGLSVVEAASRVGISPGALKVRAHRGYRALRARLSDWKRG